MSLRSVAKILFMIAVVAPVPVAAGEVEVVDVAVTPDGAGRYRFDVTLRHADSGWDHYANRWEVLDPDSGEILATRVLFHPHVNEQPFTRSLGGVKIPAGLSTVRVRGHDKVHGYGGPELTVAIPER